MIDVKKSYYDNQKLQTERHYLHGFLHREDGPAYIHYYVSGNIWYKEYFLNGLIHREDGPAFLCYNKDGSFFEKLYYLNGVEYSKPQWFNKLSIESKLKLAFGLNDD
jgi:antitoxin component YwqK of YwqJK toxin-antitoxin module